MATCFSSCELSDGRTECSSVVPWPTPRRPHDRGCCESLPHVQVTALFPRNDLAGLLANVPCFQAAHGDQTIGGWQEETIPLPFKASGRHHHIQHQMELARRSE